MKNLVRCAALLAASLWLFNLSLSARGVTVKADYDEPGRAVSLRAGEELTVKLASNPSTGYEWQIKSALDAGVLAPIGQPTYAQFPAPPMMMGVGGTQIFRYRAVKPGTQTLTFVYVRPWEHLKVRHPTVFTVSVR